MFKKKKVIYYFRLRLGWAELTLQSSESFRRVDFYRSLNAKVLGDRGRALRSLAGADGGLGLIVSLFCLFFFFFSHG